MKEIVFTTLSAILLSLSSCTSTYYYSILNTTNTNVDKVENGDFLYENDSLWIAYCFKGEDAPIQITVFNKLDIPIFVNWQHSALILNGTSYPYSEGKITYTGSAEGVSYQNPIMRGVHHTYSDTQGSIELPKHVSFIAPQTMVSHSTLRLAARFDEIENDKYKNAKLVTNKNEAENIKRIDYDLQNSPLIFGSYLTIYTKIDEAKGYRTDFFVKSLIKTKVAPNLLPFEMADRGDTFYQHIRPNNSGWELLGVTALAAGVVAIDVWVNKDNCRNCY